MPLSSQRPYRYVIATTAAAVALSACGKEEAPKPAAAPVPPPAAAAPAPAQPGQPAQPAAAGAQANSDRSLAAQVKSALAKEPSIKAHQIDVVARDGKVTLFGTVETPALREAAQKLAAAVAGVKSVESKLVVVAGS